jgi:hypothetical protein
MGGEEREMARQRAGGCELDDNLWSQMRWAIYLRGDR